MSWLVSSIANSLKLDDDAEGDDDESAEYSGTGKQESPPDDDALRSGVKEDLSEFSKTFTRQLWGVASFLAPPPSDSQIADPNPQSLERSEGADEDDSGSSGIAGIRSDLSEIGGRFRTGISNLSTNKAVSEFSKIASNFLQLVSEEGESLEDYAQRGVVGVTEEVVAFASEVAMHPQTWLDFALPYNYDEEEDFDISEVQQEHALAIEHLAPSLATLRMDLCPGYMSEGYFWKIYFVLVHPRLTSQDAELLSTPQIVKARSLLTPELQINKSNIPEVSGRGIDTLPSEAAWSSNGEHLTIASNSPESVPVNIPVIRENTSMDTANIVVDKHTLSSIEIPVIEEVSAAQSNNESSSSGVFKGIDSDKQCDEDADEWLKEELPDMARSSGTPIPVDDDDVSFSDLEEEDGEIRMKYKEVVSVSKSETKDSNDWLDVEDIDVA